MELSRRPKVLLAGGTAAEHARLCLMAEDLAAGGIDARPSAVTTSAELLDSVRQHEPDLAFCSFFRFPGPMATPTYLKDVLSREGVAWIGSSTPALELALSKPMMKERWRQRGVPTPDWIVIHREADGTIDGIERIEQASAFPYIVKPASEGNSRGIDRDSVVRTPMQLFARACLIAEEFGEALIERYMGGGTESREFTAIMIGNSPNAIVSAGEIIKQGPEPRIVTRADKDGHKTDVVPIEDKKLREEVRDLATAAFSAAGVEDYARCDIILHNGELKAIELNGQPMLPDRWFEACAAEAGLGPRQYALAVIVAGMSRIAKAGEVFLQVPRDTARLIHPAVLERLSR